MKKEELFEAMGEIDEKYIEAAEEEIPKKTVRTVHWTRWAAAAACAVVVLGTILMVAKLTDGTNKRPNSPDNPAVITANGVTIPKLTLPEGGTEAADMIGLIVYRGSIYTQAGWFRGDEASALESLIGTYIGEARGNLDEWSTQADYATELAATASGPVYTVNGYDPAFRICTKSEFLNEAGEKETLIEFFECMNGITLSTGADLFETRLRVNERVKEVQYQTFDNWNEALNNLQRVVIVPELWEKFYAELLEGKFIYTWNPAESVKTIYDTENQAFLHLTLEDGTVVSLRLIEGGYVGYESLDWYFVKMPGEVFEAVFTACSGRSGE